MVFPKPPLWRIIKTVDQNPGAGATPSTAVDLQTKAVNIACRLGNLSSFIPATKELLACKLLSPNEFKRNCKKIIALIEVARRTLISAGVQVYAFSYCSEPLAPCKRAYIDLLNMLQENRHNVDAALNARMQSLLVPLSPSFIIHKSGIPSSVVPPKSRADQRKAPATAWGPFPYTPSTAATTGPSLMPPPDAFPSVPDKDRQYSNSFRIQRKSSRPRLWTAEEIPIPAEKPEKRRRSRSPCKRQTDVDQENVIPQSHPRIYRPMPRRFGIFCTGKSSMHGPNPAERMGRPTNVRPLIRE
ncbi:uncharacterized protein LACBIDRAFT_318867 [Laccaria bicolor S238N-H82]|uniref:Predicted protein n=1 Tax=Laccaria bicolor (strain S238N-H82 / ATCC MYA-4686) TaxID=486041 RepID=B0D7A9_LACBS|nr:uncharacterized protein LACBIDRAFT_318867 [Laccaria bicolor S238N-H82]EDR09621.1 predicted protein [Laccaria bicolor S238N-H82]|eukprot:XP_001879970.1 predicted protein [Laccaria bicolor S238N-H82]